jgi:hypothetical protein
MGLCFLCRDIKAGKGRNRFPDSKRDISGLVLLECDTIDHHKANDERKFVPVNTMKSYGSMAVQLHSFLASALGGGEG